MISMNYGMIPKTIVGRSTLARSRVWMPIPPCSRKRLSRLAVSRSLIEQMADLTTPQQLRIRRRAPVPPVLLLDMAEAPVGLLSFALAAPAEYAGLFLRYGHPSHAPCIGAAKVDIWRRHAAGPYWTCNEGCRMNRARKEGARCSRASKSQSAW